MPANERVVVAEPVAPIVTSSAELRLTCLCVKRERVRVESKIATANID